MTEALQKKLAELKPERVHEHVEFDSRYVAQMEAVLMAGVPDDYLELSSTIAGCAVFGIFDFAQPSDLWPSASMEFFLARSPNLNADIVDCASSKSGLTPPGILPIAYAQGRDFIGLSTSKFRTPGVYYWQADFDEVEKPTEGSLLLIAPTVTDFLMQMRPEDLD